MATDTRPLRLQLAEFRHPWLREFVLEQRSAGMSWRRIERLLLLRPDCDVDVSHETLRSWFGDLEASA